MSIRGEVSQWERLHKAAQQAKNDLEKFEKRFAWRDVEKVIKTALSAKVDDAKEAEGADSDDPR